MRSRCNSAASHFLALTHKELSTKADKHTHILKIHRCYGSSWNQCVFIFMHINTRTHCQRVIQTGFHTRKYILNMCVHRLPHTGPFIQSYQGGGRVVFHSSDVWASFVQFRWMTEIIYHFPYVRLFLSRRKSMLVNCGSRKNATCVDLQEAELLITDNKSKWGCSVSHWRKHAHTADGYIGFCMLCQSNLLCLGIIALNHFFLIL